LEHKNHDKVFFVNFSVVLGILGALALFISVVAAIVSPDQEGLDEEQKALLAKRIEPVSQAITDPAVLMAKMAAAKPARAVYTGEEVVTKVCNGCHLAGVLGAPKEGDGAAWGVRVKAAGGLDGLTASAIKGKGSMPPRGGDAELSDDEVKAGIETMLKKSGV
jgi:cytochrome c5